MMKKRRWLKIISTILISLLLSYAYLALPSVFISLDSRLRDFMFIIRGELPNTSNVVIVDIDERSLQTYGQWPWDRKLVSTLLEKISSSEAGIIGLDIVFAEEDRSSPHKLAKSFPAITQTLPNYDALLASCFSQNPIIGGYLFGFDDRYQNEAPMIPAIFIQKGLRYNHTILQPKSVMLNTPLLQDAIYSSGFFNNTPDKNGMVRSVPLIMKYDESIYPSLAFEMVRIYSQSQSVTIHGDTIGVNGLSFGDFNVPIDNFGRLFVNFRGAGHHFEYISAADILNDKVDPQKIKNRFVLVGTSALGLSDLKAISFDSAIPGVEIHANIIDNLLQGDFLSHPKNHQLYTLIIIWLLGFMLIALLHSIRSWLVLPFALILLFALSALHYHLLFSYGILLNLLFPLLTFVVTLISSVAIDYFIEQKQKQEAKKMLGKKVSNSVMDYLLAHVDEDIVASRELEATIFFSDIQGFTSLSERLESPAKLIKMLNSYMTPMVENIISYEGTIDKFIGDAIMAYWNAPVKVENHADKALQSAIEQIEMLGEVNLPIQSEFGVNINIGIGIHTGLVTAGDMGSKGRSDYTVIGDNVNIASRLEGMTRFYDAQILISSATYEALQKKEYRIRPIDFVEVKGKNRAIEIFEVLCKTKPISEDEQIRYTHALERFRSGDVHDAFKQFSLLQQHYPSKLYHYYVQRCQDFINHPDKEFTPILKMTTK